jgi:hypothetical protein
VRVRGFSGTFRSAWRRWHLLEDLKGERRELQGALVNVEALVIQRAFLSADGRTGCVVSRTRTRTTTSHEDEDGDEGARGCALRVTPS